MYGKNSFLAAIGAAVCAVVAAGSCATHGGVPKTRYVSTPVRDTLTVSLPGYDDEFCRIRVYGNNAEMWASDYVSGGKVSFYVGSLPAGTHRVQVRAGDILADERFVKR